MTDHDCKECKERELAAWREGRAAGLREARAALERLPGPSDEPEREEQT